MTEKEKAVIEIQDELLQQKDTLLRDIRVIQKKKIKEMEELYDIKLKKKELEQELENVKQEMKKMDQHFKLMKSKGGVVETPVTEVKTKSTDVEIIDRRDSTSSRVDEEQCKQSVDGDVNHQKIDHIRVKTNLIAGDNTPKYKKDLRLEAVESRQDAEVRQQAKVHPWFWEPQTLPRLDSKTETQPGMPALQHRQQSVEENSLRTPPPEYHERSQEEARHSFLPYKRARYDSTNNYLHQHVPQHLREGLKDTVLVPVNQSSPRPEPRDRQESLPLIHSKPLMHPHDSFRAMLHHPQHPSILSYHNLLHQHLYQAQDQNMLPSQMPSQIPIRPTPQR